MRRYLPILFISYFLVILVVVGSTYLPGQAKKQQEKDVKSITVYTTLPLDQLEPLATEFEKTQQIRVVLVPLTDTEIVARMAAEKDKPQADVVVANQQTLEQLKKAITLAPYTSEQLDIIPGRFSDPENYWTGIWYDPIVFAANQDFVKQLRQQMEKQELLQAQQQGKNVPPAVKPEAKQADAKQPEGQPQGATPPQPPLQVLKWTDLLVKPGNIPQRIGITDFLAADASANLLYTLSSTNGEQPTLVFLKQLHPQIVQYAKFLATPVRMTGLGEVDIAIAVHSEVMRYVKDHFPVTVLYPEEGTAYALTGSAVVAGASHAAEAKRFMDWLTKDEVQNVLQDNKFYFIPTNPETAAYREYNAKAIRLLENKTFVTAEQKRKVLDKWVETVRLNAR